MPFIDGDDNSYHSYTTYLGSLTQKERVYCLCALYKYTECRLYFKNMAYNQLEKRYDGDEEGTKKSLVYNDGINDQPLKTKK